MSAEPVSILVADDYLIFRDGLVTLLQGEADFRVVGTAGDAAATLAFVRDLKPDVLLLDPAMPPGLSLLRDLASGDGQPVRAVVLAAVKSRDAAEALELGARGVVLKDTPTGLLFRCIRAVMAGQYWVGQGEAATLVEALRQAQNGHAAPGLAFHLTPRELEVLKAIADGGTNSEVAKELRIREDTVKHHLTSMFDKCGVSNRVELVMLAVHNQLVE